MGKHTLRKVNAERVGYVQRSSMAGSNRTKHAADGITDGILSEYGFIFDVQTVRRKCSQYAKEGILEKKKRGKEILYQPGLPFDKLLSSHPGIGNAVKLYQLFSPLGIVGNTMMEHAPLSNDLFRVKHNFFVHTLEDEMLLLLLLAIHEEKAVLLTVKSTRTDHLKKAEGVPLKIFISTRTGRRYVILYVRKRKHFVSAFRRHKAAETKESCPDFEDLLIEVLSFGPMLNVVGNESFLGLIKGRVKRQEIYFSRHCSLF